jgi:hypothetical protein
MKNGTFFCNHKARRERVLRRMSQMRAAKERKRLEQCQKAETVGTITFVGRMFGDQTHVMTLRLPAAEESRLWVDIDGAACRPRTVRGLRKMIARRIL